GFQQALVRLPDATTAPQLSELWPTLSSRFRRFQYLGRSRVNPRRHVDSPTPAGGRGRPGRRPGWRCRTSWRRSGGRERAGASGRGRAFLDLLRGSVELLLRERDVHGDGHAGADAADEQRECQPARSRPPRDHWTENLRARSATNASGTLIASTRGGKMPNS